MKFLDYFLLISSILIFLKLLFEWYNFEKIYNYFFIKRNFQEEQENPVPVEDTFFKLFDTVN